MRAVFSELLGPAGIILVAALLGGVGAFLTAVKQSNLRAKSEGNAALQVDLLRDIAARGGNRKELEELIKSRARALSADPGQAENIADGIIKRLPQLTADWEALEKNKRDVAEQEETQFRLNWEPLIRATLEKFDLFVKQCQDRGLKIELVKIDKYPLTGPVQVSLEVRTATFSNGAQLRLFYSAFVADERNHRDASIYIAGGNLNLTLTLGKENAQFKRDFFETSKVDTREAVISQTGLAPKDFTDFVDESIRIAFERFVLFGTK